MTNTRIVVIGYIALAVLGGFFFEATLQEVFSRTGIPDQQLLGDSWTLTAVLGFGISLALTAYGWIRTDWRGAAFEVAQEMRKTTWPSKAETYSSTIAVIVCSIVIAIFLGVFDFGWAEVTSHIYEVPRYIGS